MKKGFILGLLVILSLISSSSASPNETYINHSINLCFEIPNGWRIVKNVEIDNDTQIVLSDGTNAIRIDLIKNPGINKIIGDYLEYHVSRAELDSLDYDPKDNSSDAWKSAYKRFPWFANDAVCEYYKENVVKPVAKLGSTGSGISVKPDGVEYAGVATNGDSHNDINEWIIAWTKPEYNDEIICVHSLIKSGYSEKKIEWSGSRTGYIMPEPLWIVLTTINRGNKPLPKSTGSSLIELV